MPTSISHTSCSRTPASVTATPAASTTVPTRSIRRGDADRSHSTLIAPLNVSALTTSPPTTGRVTPVATRTSAGISEK